MEGSCRLCSETSKTLFNISIHNLYSAKTKAKVPLADLIQDYLTISINPSPSESSICVCCLKCIEEWHLFREKCLAHDTCLKKQEIRFEEVITFAPTSPTETTTYDVYRVDCNEPTEEKRNCFVEACTVECADETEGDVEYSSKSLVPPTKPGKEGIDEAAENDAVPLNRKIRRRLKTLRHNGAEKSKNFGTKGKRGRPKMRVEACDQQKRTQMERKRVKQRVLPKVCAICGMARTDMAAHMRWHNNERPYQCPHCPKIFVNSSNLKNHINLHTREKMYKCDLCDKEFPSSTGRSKHRETHATEHSHLCAICGKSFKYRASLARHKLIHFEEPKVKCSICDMLFLTKTRLTKHYLVHLDAKPFTCDICNRSFNRKDNLKTHKKTHLKIVKSETKEEGKDCLLGV